MRIDEQIILRLKALTNTNNLVFPATVDAVDRDTFTCTVTPIDDVEFYNVRLKAGVESVSDGLVEIPVVGSSVLVVLLGENGEQAFIAKCSEVEEILFYGGNNGGLIKVNELITQLEKVTDYITSIKEGFDQWTPPTGAPDSGAALKAAMSGKLAGLVPPDYSEIENPKVKH